MENNNAQATSATTTKAAAVDMKLEVIVIPVSDADRAEQFYRKV